MNRLGEQTAPFGAIAEPANSPLLSATAVSWGAIFAGAAAAVALSLVLLILGTGLGLSSVSPWVNEGVSAATFGVSTILWLTFTQIFASGLGGYLAGRLRTKWAVHSDEAFFRDTAHGFLAWSIASITTAALLTSTVGSIVSGGVQAGAAVAGGAASSAMSAAAGAAGASSRSGDAGRSDNSTTAYFVDSLFRKDASGSAGSAANGSSPTSPDVGSPQATAEVARIFANALRAGALPQDDLHYVAQVVATRAGLTQADAEKRVTDTYTRLQAKMTSAEATARQAADQARKTSAYSALWLFVSLLIGAFVASLFATYGGRQRDHSLRVT